MAQAEQVLTVLEDAAQRERAVAAVTESTAVLNMIERASRDPAVNVETMERLYRMHTDALARRSREAYDAAFAEMQVELPTIDQTGRIVITDKNDRNKIIQTTAFAKFEDINDAIKPCLARHGFGLSFRTGLSPDGRVTVTGILSHRAGHREETTMVLPHDSTGSKNAVQAIGSSTSYGRRYTTLALLNITSRIKEDRDDDGQAASGPALLSEDQVIALRDLLLSFDRDEKAFCEKVAKVPSLADIRADMFDEAMRVIKAAGRRK